MDKKDTTEFEERIRASRERLQLAEAASGIGTFEMDLRSGHWDWSPQVAVLFGLDPRHAPSRFEKWQRSIFIDDVPKVAGALREAAETGSYYVEFRVRRSDNSVHWLAGKGQMAPDADARPRLLRGTYYEITERKGLEARLLSLNETLEARVAEVREEAHTLEVLNRTGVAVAAELDMERLVQIVADAGVDLTHAEFGAFFYNAVGTQADVYSLYALSGVSREEFAGFSMPGNTAIFEPALRGRQSVRSDDIQQDARYGHSSHHGMPAGGMPVRSYLAVPVVSRGGDVLGGLVFGHRQPSVFTDRAERIVAGLAAQAAVAIDNARLYQTSQREIAARKEAEQELRRINETLEERAAERARQLAASLTRLEETERRFRLVVEAVTDYAIFMLDPTGNVVNWNPGAERIKGYGRDEIIGRPLSIFYTSEEQQRGAPQSALATAKETGKYETEGWRVRKDQSVFWASVVINAIYAPQGELLGFAKITRDLTERRAADERARQAQKMEAVGHLTGGVAHDFNNLLTIIVGNLESVQRQLRSRNLDAARLQRSTDNAMRGARRAESLTHRLLAFSRQQPLDPKSIDLGRLVFGMTDLLRQTIGEQIAIETVLDGGLWRAHADPNQLELGILNLAVNARDAMPNGGKLTLETANVYLDEKYATTQAEVLPGQYVMLAVSDNGCGMAPDVKAKAFDPFFSTKGVGQGTGLGLSQVYGFVKQSRGHVKIYSEVGEGTTIKIYLPRAHGIDAVDADGPADAVALGSGTETVLVVEDDEDVRNYSCETLRELGYKVVEAPNGRAALQMLERHPDIRVLFTDVGLPGGMNGRQLADEVLKRRPKLRVLFTTGYARNAIVHEGRLDPGVELITKPFTQAALAAKLRDIIDAQWDPGRVLVIEDERLIQMLAVVYLEQAGFKVDTAGSASEAMSKLSLIPGGVDAVIVDLVLPDRKGDVLIRELRALYPTLPIVIATGHGRAETENLIKGQPQMVVITKPYNAGNLLAALRTLGISC
jgi:PAS domain S-box-containing protein